MPGRLGKSTWRGVMQRLIAAWCIPVRCGWRCVNSNVVITCMHALLHLTSCYPDPGLQPKRHFQSSKATYAILWYHYCNEYCMGSNGVMIAWSMIIIGLMPCSRYHASHPLCSLVPATASHGCDEWCGNITYTSLFMHCGWQIYKSSKLISSIYCVLLWWSERLTLVMHTIHL